MKFPNEVKIGLFIVSAICVGIIFWTKTQNLSAGTYNLKTYFGFAGGLKENSTVTLSGIVVGRVEKINFIYDPETKVEVILSIKNNAKVHTDAIIYITTSGFIGDSLIGMTPGTSGYPFAKDGDTLESEDPMNSRDLMKKANAIATKADETLTDIKALAHNVNMTYENNRNNIDNMIKNFEQTSENFNEFSEDIKKHPWKLLIKGK